ncbi:osmotically inducible protein OsmC [Sphingobacterium allocomposti]|uniref:Osmotically inducible protein OsmC n=1 Tax=Sphingobacterium allocomposti TaxID=415956 RepID=A0A5S5D8E5_9SPHI|nr:OsmC family peroxiredoxin [Sphingobacterium composti Yoo et al. 2007 non Ten et al. 2007]TYP91326.1 osmotically inducible protein OsmC [Sphingobacterium composti Yoo et al. 2007 non Ten et al. 2007]
MQSKITAVWQGSFKEGSGKLDAAHSSLHNVTFAPVFAKNETTAISNPEELLESAHATCYNLTLSYILSQAGIRAEKLETSAELTLKNKVITNSDLTLTAKIPDITEEQFQGFAQKAKEMCAVGNAIKAEISLKATLE